jgi:uncharacterized protein YdaU (DUF1376 family)
MTDRNGLFVEYCAKDFLDGTQTLDAWEELAYRRIVDMIYATNDKLADDDRKLGWMTKTGSRWKRIKAALIAAGKIEVIDGRITNARCQAELQKTAQKIEQKRQAGLASSATGKSLKNLKQHRTGARTGDRTEHRTTQEPNEPEISESPDGDSADPRRVIFTTCATWLAAESGRTLASAKEWLGHACKRFGDGNVIDACARIRAGPYRNGVVAALTDELKRMTGNGQRSEHQSPHRKQADAFRWVAEQFSGEAAGDDPQPVIPLLRAR